MIVLLRPDTTPEQRARVTDAVRALGLVCHERTEGERTVLELPAAAASSRCELEQMAGVERVFAGEPAAHLVTLDHRSEPTLVRLGPDATFGGGSCAIIAGPCAVEEREVLLEIARAVKAAGAQVLRGGAFKPRTSPYAFRGLGREGLELLAEARAETGLPVVTEVMDTRDVEVVEQYADMLQIGSRNMHNFALLAEVGRTRKPVMLKRGMSATVEELLTSAEYVLAGGNDQVVLCERGIRTFDRSSRNTLDLTAVALLRERTHLPVVVDPSHACGRRSLVPALARAAAALGADGVMIEVHVRPHEARSDGPQAILPHELQSTVSAIRAIETALGTCAAPAPTPATTPESTPETSPAAAQAPAPQVA